MKTKLLLFAALAAPCGLHAATIALPVTPTFAISPDAGINPDISVSAGTMVNASIDTTHAGSTNTGDWAAAATGGTSVTLLGGLGGMITLAGLDLNTRTTLATDAIRFGTVTTSSGMAGSLLSALNLQTIVGAGLVQTWSATVNLSALDLVFAPETTYSLTFDLTQSTALLGNLSPAVFNNFTATVGDNGGTYGQGSLPAGLLGITDIFGESGKATLQFTTGSVMDGPVIATFGASAAADTDLLDGLLRSSDTTLYTISGLDIQAVPEPSSIGMFVAFASLGLLRRKVR